MKKILFYTDTPIYGGAEKQMLLLAKFLDRSKYEITLCSTKNPGLSKWQHDFRQAGFKTVEIAASHKHDPRHYFAVKKILQQEHFDLIHCHIWNPASCRYALQAAKNTSTPIVTTEHDPFPLSGLKAAIKQYQLKSVQKIICISQNNLELLTTLYPGSSSKLSLVHNGIDIDEFQQQINTINNSEKQKFLAESTKNTNSNNKIIACIAALHERKGVDLLIKAFANFSKQHPNYQLLMTGSGPEAESLQKLIDDLNLNNKVFILGQIQNIPLLLASSDFFVLPSRREAFGLVLLEAMCAKLPILSTKTGGITDILSTREASLVEPNSASELEKGLIELSSQSHEQIAQKVQFAHSRLTQEFSAKKMAERTEKVYDAVIL